VKRQGTAFAPAGHTEVCCKLLIPYWQRRPGPAARNVTPTPSGTASNRRALLARDPTDQGRYYILAGPPVASCCFRFGTAGPSDHRGGPRVLRSAGLRAFPAQGKTCLPERTRWKWCAPARRRNRTWQRPLHTQLHCMPSYHRNAASLPVWCFTPGQALEATPRPTCPDCGGGWFPLWRLDLRRAGA